MGEAKRRGLQAKQVGEGLRARIAAGEFGTERPAQGWLFVVDRSQRGLELRRLLGELGDCEGLAALLAAEPFRLWEVSKLFPYVVLRGGPGTPEQRTQLVANTERLLGEALPRAAQALARRRWGAEAGVDPAVQPAVTAALARLKA